MCKDCQAKITHLHIIVLSHKSENFLQTISINRVKIHIMITLTASTLDRKTVLKNEIYVTNYKQLL